MDTEGKRLNKYISDAGVASRREADRMIEAGRVEIRRKSRRDEEKNPVVKASPGDRVRHGDTVYVDGRELPKKEPPRVCLAYYKPRGVVCTLDRSIPGNLADAVDWPTHITYAGRLDKDSEGLLILTNDGALADRMMRASSQHEKEYVVTVDHALTQEFLKSMAEGVRIHLDDETTLRRHPGGLHVTTRPAKVKRLSERKFTIVLTQGYNRQIRRMCRALGYGVSDILRTRVMNIRIGDLRAGSYRRLSAEELKELDRESRKLSHS